MIKAKLLQSCYVGQCKQCLCLKSCPKFLMKLVNICNKELIKGATHHFDYFGQEKAHIVTFTFIEV